MLAALISGHNDMFHKDSDYQYTDYPAFATIPQTWQLVHLFEVTSKYQTGGTPPLSKGIIEQEKQPCYPWIGASNITDSGLLSGPFKYITHQSVLNNGYHLFPPNTPVLVCIGSTTGKCCFVEDTSFSNQQLTGLIPNNTINAKFLFYAMCYQRNDIRRDASFNSIVPIINHDYLDTICVPLPPIEEQNEIVETISDMDNEIITFEQQYLKLASMKKSLLRRLITGEIRMV